MNYGNKIAELRKSKNLTQSELGGKLNITAQAVSKWENNLSEPDIDSIKKMCEIFEISVDEFLGVATHKEVATTKVENTPEQIKIISGYCESCKKPVGPNEYKVTHFSFNPNAIGDKVKSTDIQHIYCNDCHKKLLDAKAKDERNKAIAVASAEKAENRSNLFKGLIWGSIVSVIMFLITFIPSLTNNSLATNYPIIIALTIGGFTAVSQLFWGEIIADTFFFFCRSFKAPFGFIFELSLDGILWLLTVKLLLWIFFGLLSIAFFLLGLVVTIVMSYFVFPFALGKQINSVKNSGRSQI